MLQGQNLPPMKSKPDHSALDDKDRECTELSRLNNDHFKKLQTLHAAYARVSQMHNDVVKRKGAA